MTQKHTPTPWKVRTNGDDCFIEAQPNNKIKAYGIEIMGDDTHPDHYPDEQKLADAAFIVRAVNSHDALIQAAEIGLIQVEKNEGKDKTSSQIIKAALAMAKGKL